MTEDFLPPVAESSQEHQEQQEKHALQQLTKQLDRLIPTKAFMALVFPDRGLPPGVRLTDPKITRRNLLKFSAAVAATLVGVKLTSDENKDPLLDFRYQLERASKSPEAFFRLVIENMIKEKIDNWFENPLPSPDNTAISDRDTRQLRNHELTSYMTGKQDGFRIGISSFKNGAFDLVKRYDENGQPILVYFENLVRVEAVPFTKANCIQLLAKMVANFEKTDLEDTTMFYSQTGMVSFPEIVAPRTESFLKVKTHHTFSVQNQLHSVLINFDLPTVIPGKSVAAESSHMINNSYGDINYLLYSSGVTFEARLPVDNPGAMATIQGINAVSGILFDPADLDLLRQEVAKWAPAAARAQQEFLTNPGFVKKLMEELPSVIPEDSQTGEERVIFQMLINLAGESNKPVPLAIQGPYNFTQGEPTPPAPVNAGPVVGPSA